MEIIEEKIQHYIEAHTDEESALLQKINRHTQLKVMMPRMISGRFQGRLLSFLSQMLRPKHILEIGTYTGYSALCFAEGLQADGTLTTIDINEELEDAVRAFFKESKYNDQIDYRIGNAVDIIPTLTQRFDLVFIDADKINYSLYYDLVIDKVTQGGVILADNVLWSGKVVNTDKKVDKDTQALLDFNKKIQDDSRVSNVLLPVRDGIMMIRKL